MERRRKSQAGFTLIEMLIVIAIIGMIATFVGLNVIKKYDQARVDSTRIQITQLKNALNDFRRMCGQYPTTEQGLDSLVNKPQGGRECKGWSQSLEKVPQDAWNHDFLYTSNGSDFEIKSLGADGAEGGDGVNADISSKDL